MSKTLLVTGATGKQGGAVIDALLDADPTGSKFTILAVTRNASSASSKHLAERSQNIRLVQGNLDDVPALFEAAKCANNSEPVWGVFSVQVSLGPGVTVEGEVTQGTALIDGAIEAGVKHFVYSSVERGGDSISWENPTPIPHFQSKQRIEQHLRAVTAAGEAGGSMGWTVLRPVAFMDNLAPGFPTKVFLAALRNWLGDNRKTLQWVATRDIGVFAAKAFEDAQNWNRKAVGLAGDELTVEQLSSAFAKATGKPAPIAYWPFGSALTCAVKEMGLMIGWFASDGYKADIEARRRDHPGMLTMEQWLAKKSGWAANK
ncbi:putative negative transcriptional regulator [Cladorrhinum sp. PSN259]|nr:putative negative transcriptional regulator [Cladorrhinum sp. PSN259]